MSDYFCSIDVPSYVQKECGIERAGIVAIALLDLDQNPSDANLESATWWNTVLSASPTVAVRILQTRGEYNGGTPTEEEGFGREATQVTGADHEATVEVEGLLDNRDFYEAVNRKKWLAVLVTNADLMYYINSPVTVYAKISNPRNIKSNAFWSLSLKWQSFDNPRVLEAPANVFEDS
jgi:hypothetical protein